MPKRHEPSGSDHLVQSIAILLRRTSGLTFRGWWPLLAGGDATLPNVVARLPFLAMPNARARGISALVLARMEPEESGDDSTLIAIETPAGLSRDRIAGGLAKVGLPTFTSALDQVVDGVHHYLIEMPGVIADGDQRLRELGAALGLKSGRVAAISCATCCVDQLEASSWWPARIQ